MFLFLLLFCYEAAYQSVVFSFVGVPKTDDLRLLTTESMHIGPGYIMQFELVMGCGLPYSQVRDAVS